VVKAEGTVARKSVKVLVCFDFSVDVIESVRNKARTGSVAAQDEVVG